MSSTEHTGQGYIKYGLSGKTLAQMIAKWTYSSDLGIGWMLEKLANAVVKFANALHH